MSTLEEVLWQASNRLAKWRQVFAGWQLGTRSKDDPECAAVRDHREATILLRVEVNALVELLITKGLISKEEWQAGLVAEIETYQKDLEQRFPGMTATDIGMRYSMPEAGETMRLMNFKP